jgi:hypothetical protein
MKPSLPIAVRWVVRLVVPARSRDQVLSDLEDDYARVHARRRPFAARWWLFRETTSVMASYSAAPFERAGEAWPAWSRDVRLVIRGFRRGGALTAAGAAAMLAVGLLAVLVTAGLSQTLLFRQVSASYGDRLRRVRDRGCRARTRIIELHGRQRRCLGARRSRRSGAQSRMANRPRQSMVHRVCARDRDERGSRGAPRCRGTGTRENAP